MKDIGSMACVLNGKVDQIIVTGGVSLGNSLLVQRVKYAGARKFRHTGVSRDRHQLIDDDGIDDVGRNADGVTAPTERSRAMPT